MMIMAIQKKAQKQKQLALNKKLMAATTEANAVAVVQVAEVEHQQNVVFQVRVRVEEGLPPEADQAAGVIDSPAVARRWVVVTVEDTGCGIAEEQVAQIFDPFVSFRDDGTGLGLSIVHQIVRLHRGHIRIRSRVGEGTAFAIFFPCEDGGDPPC